MDSTPEPPARGARGPYGRRDRAITWALRTLHGRLRGSTYAVYLPTESGRMLAAAVVADTPLSFTVTPEVAIDDLRFSAPRAHRTGRLVVFDAADLRRLTRDLPATVLHTSHEMLLASAPVRTARRRFGVVSVRWLPARPLAPAGGTYLQEVADTLAAALENLYEDGESMNAPALPLFVPLVEAPPTGSETDPGQADEGPALRDGAALGPSACLYQMQRLSSMLTATERIRDVVDAAWYQVARPFGGRAVMLCLARAGRLHVVGSAGFSRQSVHRVEGTLLSAHTPETDALATVESRFYTTAEELWQVYPGLRHDPECEARAYLPLISQGRAVGCCVLEFPQPARRFATDERAVLILMMGQLGQTLVRVHSYEAEHAFVQTMQRSLLPGRLPQVPEAVTTARYLPAATGEQVGGDWYDVVQLPEGRLGLVIGDVEGHTLEAVGIMGLLRSGLRAYAAEGHEPASVLERSNRLLMGLDTDLYATSCCMWLDLTTGVASAASAGHHGPLVSDVHGRAVPAPVPVGPPLGVTAQAVYRQSEFTFEPGSVAALFTDGLLATRELGVDAAIERLCRLLADNCCVNLETLADLLVAQTRQGPVSDDDTALLLVRYEGAHLGTGPRVARTSVLRHDLQGVARVRRFLRELLPQWDVAAFGDELELLASEVVTNALIHAHSGVDVQVRSYPDRLRVEVRDSDPHPPVPTAILTSDVASNQEAESGRGLLIVDALAADWGSSPAGRGKTTWFDIALP